jgi:hypothetical protein
VRSDLGVRRPARDEHVAHECEAARTEQQIVDLAVEQGCRVSCNGHAASFMGSSSSAG